MHICLMNYYSLSGEKDLYGKVICTILWRLENVEELFVLNLLNETSISINNEYFVLSTLQYNVF